MELLTDVMLRCTKSDMGTPILQRKDIFVALQQKICERPAALLEAHGATPRQPPSLTFARVHPR
jgi:hypothetical protein